MLVHLDFERSVCDRGDLDLSRCTLSIDPSELCMRRSTCSSGRQLSSASVRDPDFLRYRYHPSGGLIDQ